MTLYMVDGKLMVMEPSTTIRCEFPECSHWASDRDAMEEHLFSEHLLLEEEPTYAEPDEEGVYHVTSLEEE